MYKSTHEWSDVLGNNATALEIVRSSQITNSVSSLAEWCEDQARGLWDNAPDDVDWERLTSALIDDAAHERVRGSALAAYEDTIFYDWTEGTAHLLWIATATASDIVSWAKGVEDAAENATSS